MVLIKNPEVDGMEDVMVMEVEDATHSEDQDEGTLLSVESTWWITQEYDPGVTIIYEASNGFNDMICPDILCTAQY